MEQKYVYKKIWKKNIFHSIFEIFLLLQDVAGTEIKKLWTSNTISLTCSLNFYPQLPASLISHKSHFYEVIFKIMTCSIAFLSRTAVHITSITSYYSLPCSNEAICIVKTFKFHSLKNIFIAIELCLYHCAVSTIIMWIYQVIFTKK